jgi:hypothetical protein
MFLLTAHKSETSQNSSHDIIISSILHDDNTMCYEKPIKLMFWPGNPGSYPLTVSNIYLQYQVTTDPKYLFSDQKISVIMPENDLFPFLAVMA